MNTKLAFAVTILAAAVLVACSPATGQTISAPTPSPMATPLPEFAATLAPINTGNAGQVALLPPASQMVIKNADLELLVSDTDLVLDQVTQMAADHGGYIISSETWFAAELKHGNLRLAIPSNQFEAALNRLRHLGLKVLRETTSGQDVSAEYSDLQARLTNLEATAARVRGFLDDAKTVDEALTINARLSELEGQIEQIMGQMRYYEGRAAFSTVTVTLTPEAAQVTPTPEPTWNPGRTFAGAGRVLVRLSQTALDAAIWIAVLGAPVLLGLAAVVGIARLTARRAR